MNDQSAPDTQVWGSPEPAAARWGLRETVLSIGVAAVIAGLGGAAIYAATGSSGSPSGPPPFGHSMPGGPPPFGGAAGCPIPPPPGPGGPDGPPGGPA